MHAADNGGDKDNDSAHVWLAFAASRFEAEKVSAQQRNSFIGVKMRNETIVGPFKGRVS